jgi:hypothetical protein
MLLSSHVLRTGEPILAGPIRPAAGNDLLAARLIAYSIESFLALMTLRASHQNIGGVEWAGLL